MFREIKRQGINILTALGYSYNSQTTADVQPLLDQFAERLQTDQTFTSDQIQRLLHIVVTRKNVRNFSLFSSRKYSVDLDNQTFPVVEKGDGQKRAWPEMLMRGQLENDDPNNPVQSRWELNNQFHLDERFFFNSAVFPAILRWTEEGGQGRAMPVPFRVCYSSFEPAYTTYAQMLSNNADPNDLLLIQNKPNWVRMKLSPDPKVGSGDLNKPIYVYVDSTYIADNNAALSIMSALQNSFPVAGSYIYMYPDVVNRELFGSNSPFSNPANSKVGGASLGMAVFAAVSGWPPYMYTGYIPYPVPGYKLQGDQVYRGLVNSEFHRTHPGFYEKAGPDTASVAPGYEVAAKALVRVSKQLNFVESVADLPLKMAFAIANSFPFICPASTSLGEATSSVLSRLDNQAFFRTYLEALPTFYTMSMAQDGEPAATFRGNQVVVANVFLGSTVTEFSTLAGIASWYLDDLHFRRIMGGFNKNNVRFNQKQDSFVSAILLRKQELGQKSAALFDERKQERAQLDKEFQEKKITAQQWTQAMREKRSQRKELTSAKKAVKKSKQASDKMKRAQIRDRISSMAEAYKNAYEQHKLELGPAPTKKQLSDFYRQWKKPQNIKKQLNKKMFKDIFENVLLMPRTVDSNLIATGKRNSLIRQLIEAKLDAPAIVSTVNNIYGASLGMLDANTTVEALKEMSTKPDTRREQPTYSLGDSHSRELQAKKQAIEAQKSALTEDAAASQQQPPAIADRAPGAAMAITDGSEDAAPTGALVASQPNPMQILLTIPHTSRGSGTPNEPYLLSFPRVQSPTVNTLINRARETGYLSPGPNNTLAYNNEYYIFQFN